MSGARMPEIPQEKLSEAQKKAVAELIAGPRGRIGGPFIPLLRSPETLTRVQKLGEHLRFNSVLPPRLSEFLILLVARTWTQGTEWHAHRGLALKGGLKPDIVEAIAEGRRPDAMAADEAALYDLYDELQRNRCVSDATYARLIAHFGEQGVIDAVAILGYYTLLAMVMNTTRVPVPAEAEHRLKPFPY
ncbi:MAG TPA: carboxymuconolactone decarboxylase family protein [Xanthobacteraceae bacterium]|nr:carboxymuconolactone decarboxylase family protein [Xanthobacteraceae bacterium]